MDQEGLPGDEEDMPEMTHPAPQAAGSGHCTMHPTPLAGHGIQVSPHCSPFAPGEALLLSNYDIQSTGGFAPEELWEEAPEEDLPLRGGTLQVADAQGKRTMTGRSSVAQLVHWP